MKKNKIDIQPKQLTVFDIPSDEAKKYLSAIIKDVNTIMSNPKFMEAIKKVNLPDNATIADFEKLVTRVAPAKIYSFLSLFIDECYDEVRRILSAIFITDYEIYKRKSLRSMCDDVANIEPTHLGKILGFFLRSGI